MVYPKLICLLAFLPIIFSYPTPPIPTDPAIRFQFTKTGFEKLDDIFMSRDCTEDVLGLIFELDYNGETLNGSASRTAISESKTEVIENTKEAFSHEGFIRLDTLENTLHRKKRDASTHTKVYYEDSEFMAGQEIGGVKISQKGLSYKVTLNKGNDQFQFELTNGVKVVQMFLGQQDGRLKIGRLAVEIDGDLKASKNGEDFELTEEKRDEFLQTFFKNMIRKLLVFAKSRYGDYKNILGSKVFDKVVFDYRLTEHPQFKDGVAEFALVGKFIYDEEEKYTDKMIFEELEKALSAVKLLQHSDNLETGDDTYTKVFNLYDTEETPKTKALATEGSDEEEAAKKALATIRINLSEDFFNSFIETSIKSGITKIQLQSFMLESIIGLYNSINVGTPIDVSKIPKDLTIFFDLQHYGDGQKFYTFYDGGAVEKIALAIKINDLVAIYKIHSKVDIIYRNGKFAFDLLKLKIDKEADKGFPDIWTEEGFKKLNDDYFETASKHFVSIFFQEILTEYSLKEGHFIFGLNTRSFH